MRDYIIKTYGEKAFYEYLKIFIKKHRENNAAIEYDNELRMPIRAVYLFEPVTVACDNLNLIEKIRKANNEEV